MRYLLYYPMVHIQNDNYLAIALMESITEVLNKKFSNREISELEAKTSQVDMFKEIKKFKGEFKGLAKTVGAMWDDFSSYLNSQNKFDRVYLEGTFEEGQLINYENRKKGMFGCINMLLKSGAIFEKTEDEFIYDMDKEIHLDRKMEIEIHKLRERSAMDYINKSLKENERGVFLFGAGHKEGIIEIYKENEKMKKSIDFWIYDQERFKNPLYKVRNKNEDLAVKLIK